MSGQWISINYVIILMHKEASMTPTHQALLPGRCSRITGQVVQQAVEGVRLGPLNRAAGCPCKQGFLTLARMHVTRQIWGIWKLWLAYSPETPNLGQNQWCFVPCDLEIWQMTLENDRASLLCCFKLCATFHSHWWIQTGVTVRKRPFWVNFDDF